MSFKKAIEQLKALPEEKRVLISGEYHDENTELCCALGVLIPHLSQCENVGIRQLATDYDEIENGLDNLNLTKKEAELLQEVNDNFGINYCISDNSDTTNKARYTHVLNWMIKQENKT